MSAQDLSFALPYAFETICKRRNVNLNASALKEIISTTQVASCVLAGGASSRMGQDKKLLPLGKGTLLSGALRSASLFSNRFLSVCANEPAKFETDYVTVPDATPNLGPLSGIVSVLSLTNNPWTLIIPCDMPFMTSELLDYLIGFRKEEFDVILFSESGKEMTFPLLLRTETARPVLENALKNNSLALWRNLKDKLRILAVPAEECVNYKSFSLKNVNTMGDYEELKDNYS